MTSLPAQISIYNFQINTFGIFLMFGFLLLAYVIWSEGKNDGFDEEKLFDLLLISAASSIMVSRIGYALYHVTNSSDFFNHVFKVWTPGYNAYGALLGVVVPLFLLCKKWKWSVYRIIDIYSLGISLAASVIILGLIGLQAKFDLLFAFSSFLFLYALLSKIRTEKIKSGYSFSAFALISASLGLIFFGSPEYLIFYFVLVTLALVVFLFRWRLHKHEPLKFAGRFIERIKSAIGKKRS